MPGHIRTKEAKLQAKTEKLAQQLAMFDSLPDSALVALPVVCALKGRSAASVWRDVRFGRLAQPVKAGPRCTRWRVGDLKAKV